MLKPITLVFALVLTLSLSAQERGGCGTKVPAGYTHVLSASERSATVQHPNNQRSGIRWVPVFYHIITKDDGTGGTSLKNIFISHCDLNYYYNQFNIGFYIRGIDTVKNTVLWNYQTMTNDDAFPLYNVANVCNVYINGNLPGLCGVSTFTFGSQNGGGIFLNKACIGINEKTFPHEMGHYFNLLHTFETFLGVEYVDGSNCSTAGDGFCDTPADFLDQRTQCPYTGNVTDPHGDLYRTVIDPTLFMSYFDDNCVYRFSTQEQNEMNGCLTSQRAYLLNQNMPDISPLDSAIFLNPVNGDNNVLSGSVNFRWHVVPRAMYYRLRVENGTSSFAVLDTLVTDTSFTMNNAAPGKSYKYRVYGICYGNACASVEDFNYFATSTIKGTLSVNKPSCQGADNGTVTITPANGTSPYTFNWSTGATTSSISNVSSGVYYVTITDSLGVSAVSSVVVTEPTAVGATVYIVGTNLNASGFGGTPPYTYLWSDGNTGSGDNNVSHGSYSVTVTDSKGCTGVQSITFSSIGVEPSTTVSMKAFPNPASSVASLNVQIELNKHMNANLSLVNVSGQTIIQLNKALSSGTNNIEMNIEQVPSGIYFLKLSADGLLKTEKISVIR